MSNGLFLLWRVIVPTVHVTSGVGAIVFSEITAPPGSDSSLAIWMLGAIIVGLGILAGWLKPMLNRVVSVYPAMPDINTLIAKTVPAMAKDLAEINVAYELLSSSANTMAMVVSGMQSQMAANRTLLLIVESTRFDQANVDHVCRITAMKYGLTIFFANTFNEAAMRMGLARVVILDGEMPDMCRGALQGLLAVCTCPVIIHAESPEAFIEPERVFAVIGKKQSMEILKAEMERAVLSTVTGTFNRFQ